MRTGPSVTGRFFAKIFGLPGIPTKGIFDFVRALEVEVRLRHAVSTSRFPGLNLTPRDLSPFNDSRPFSSKSPRARSNDGWLVDTSKQPLPRSVIVLVVGSSTQPKMRIALFAMIESTLAGAGLVAVTSNGKTNSRDSPETSIIRLCSID